MFQRIILRKRGLVHESWLAVVLFWWPPGLVYICMDFAFLEDLKPGDKEIYDVLYGEM